MHFFAWFSPPPRGFSRAFGCRARKGAVGTLRRMSVSAEFRGNMSNLRRLSWPFLPRGCVPSRWPELVHGKPHAMFAFFFNGPFRSHTILFTPRSGPLRNVISSITFTLPAVFLDAATYIIKMKIHSSCEIEDFVETHLCKLCVILRSRALRVVCPHQGYRSATPLTNTV